MVFVGAPEEGEGRSSSKSKSMRETWAAAFWALDLESVVAKLLSRVSREKGGEEEDARRVHFSHGGAVARLEGVVPPNNVVDEVVHEQQPI